MSSAGDEWIEMMQNETSVTFDQHCENCGEEIPFGKEIYLCTKSPETIVCQHIVCEKCSKKFVGKKLKDFKKKKVWTGLTWLMNSS